MVKWILSSVVVFCSLQASAQTADEVSCLQQLPDLQAKIAAQHAIALKNEMTSVLMVAYRRFGAPITADKIIYGAPQTSFGDGQVPQFISTDIIAKVDAGPNAIVAQGSSSFSMEWLIERQNETDELGRITATKLKCALIGGYYGIRVINVTSRQVIDDNQGVDSIEVSVDLP